MSVDQVPIEKNKFSKNSKSITVVTNGIKIQSSLNPDALEFYPSNLKKYPQASLNENMNAKKCIAEQREIQDKNQIDTETTKSRAEKSRGIHNASHKERIVIVKDTIYNKLKHDSDKNLLRVIFTSPSVLTSSSSESTTAISTNNEKESIQILTETESLILEKTRDLEITERESFNNCNSNLNDENNNGNEKTEIVYISSVDNYMENKNEAKVQHKVKDTQKKLPSNSKIAKAATATAIRYQHEIKPKIETTTTTSTLNQNFILTKNSKKPTNVNLKHVPLNFNKSSIPAISRDLTKSFNKDTASNRSTSSTEKSSSSIKSCSKNMKVTFAETSIRKDFKRKEHVPKSPRATVSSKLRKAETQKRRNLFFDLDSIKMSDFIFK